MPRHHIRTAITSDKEVIADLISSLIEELLEDPSISTQCDKYLPTIENFLSVPQGVFIFVAEDEHGIAKGVITLNECRAIYALGVFGEISELYVTKDSRSSGLGEELIIHAKNFAKSKSWRLLEVGTAHLPRWQRSLDFYLGNKFSVVGSRLEFMIEP